MFLGFDDSLKPLKKELKELGADIGSLRDWQKSYDKVRKQAPLLEDRYNQVREELKAVYQILQEMEQLVSSELRNAGVNHSQIGNKMAEWTKKMKKYQEHFTQEFLISKEDREFHLTYTSLMKLCGKPLQNTQDVLILQSEIENLLAIVKEALEKAVPNFRSLAFFYLSHEDKELAELPHQEKITWVEDIYEREFLSPIRQLLYSCMDDDRVKQIMEVELWNY